MTPLDKLPDGYRPKRREASRETANTSEEMDVM